MEKPLSKRNELLKPKTFFNELSLMRQNTVADHKDVVPRYIFNIFVFVCQTQK